jgi:hypothetical protein
MIVVQRIVTSWTKATRGAEGREARARLPKAYPIPEAIARSSAACVRHQVSRSAHDDYRLIELVEEDAAARVRKDSRPTAITLVERDGHLEVAFVVGGDEGAPRRRAAPILLPTGAWGRARYNGRFSSFDEPWYEEKVLNIAYGMSPVSTLFVGEPGVLLEALVDLW